MADELEALRKQLEIEQGLREAADAENERLMAQVEAYAEDMATLFAEQHGRGRDGLAAEVADLRSRLEDESAQRDVVARLHKRSAQQVRELSDQLAKQGEDVSRAFREGKKAAAAPAGPWWRRPAAVLPVMTTVAGLVLGAGGYAALAPTPTPLEEGLVYGPPAPPELGGPPVLVASGGRLQPLGAGAAAPLDAAALAGTAAAGFAPADSALKTAGGGTPLSGTAAGTGTARLLAGAGTPTPRAEAATATALAPLAASAPGSSPSRSPIPAGDLAPTVTALAATGTAAAATVTAAAATGTALAGVATSAAATVTAIARARPSVSPTATLAVVELSPEAKKERCRFELLLPVLEPGASYAIAFEQRQAADVVVLWSEADGAVALERLVAGGAPQPVGQATSGGQGVVLRGAPAGGYRATLTRRSGQAEDSRVGLFYDAGASCFPAPRGDAAAAGTGATGELPSPTGTPATGGGTPLPAAATAAAPGGATSPAPAGTTSPALAGAGLGSAPSPVAPSPTLPPTPPGPVAPTQAAPVSSPSARATTPTPPQPTPTPVRAYVDCRPYLRGPSGVLELHPRVYADAAHTVLTAWPLHARLWGPGVDTSADFRATPEGAVQALPLGGYGQYYLSVEAPGADLDPDCFWEFEHDQYV